MENGHWSAIRDGVVDKIKSDRPASIGDFALIVTQMHRRKTHTSISRLAERLCWSHRKVRSWLGKVGLKIEYFGEKKNPNGGILGVIPKENLDPKTKGFWIVVSSEKPIK